MARIVRNIPKADHLMGSMRSMGYTFEAAIADIIDNSISANSHNVHLFFPSDPIHCFVSILDDGDGMTKSELLEAMRYGSTSRESMRSETDLGRFGLGLKAASLSQCSKLTVVSKKDQHISSYRWDYNFIKENKDWDILELNDNEIAALPTIDSLKNYEHGTLVIWEDFDVLEKSNNGQIYAALCDYKSKIAQYIGLIFHRYIGAKGGNAITMRLNNHKVKALDPFLETHEKTTKKKEVSIEIKDSNGVERYIKVKPYVLPYYKDLSPSDIEKLGGYENLRTKQGYYLYRNRRLIRWGTWFGLHTSHELTKNARIRVDIPNSLDDIWQIDIKKQEATIPKIIQTRLRRKVEEALEFSIRQYTHRGRRNNINGNIDFIWNRIEDREGHYFYEINRDSPFIAFAKSKIPDEYAEYVDMLIDEIEKHIPIQQMYIDQSNNAIIEKEDPNREEDLFHKAILMVEFAQQFSEVTKDTIDRIFKNESFYGHPNLKERLYKHFEV